MVHCTRALLGADGGSCHCSCRFQRRLPEDQCDADVCLYLFHFLIVVCLLNYVKLGLAVGVTKQMSGGNEVEVQKC